MASPSHLGVAGVKEDPIHTQEHLQITKSLVRKTPYTPKNTSKPSKSLVIKYLVLSTPLKVLVLG